MKTYFEMKVLCFTFLVLLPFFAQGQRDVELIFPSAIHIGVSLANVEHDSSSAWSQSLGNAFVLNTGMGGLYKRKFGVTAQAGFSINTYNFSNGNAEYSISSITSSAFINTYFLFKIKDRNNPRLHVGTDLGWNFYSKDFIQETNDEFQVTTVSYGPKKFFIAPELGITAKQKRMALSILGTYSFNQNTDSVIAMRLTDVRGGFNAYSKCNYLGLKLRFTYTLAGHKEPVNHIETTPADAQEMQARRTNDYQVFNVNKRSVKLILWDNGEIDNDSISVVLNGEYVLANYKLTNDKKKLKIRLHAGSNQIVVMAHNEGAIPPNTAQCKMICGRKKWDFAVSCGLKSNAGIEIVVN